MTADEVRAVAEMMTEADGHCFSCAKALMEDLARFAPEHRGLIEDVLREVWPDGALDG